MGRPKKYPTEEARKQALRVQKRDYFRRNAPSLNEKRRCHRRETINSAQLVVQDHDHSEGHTPISNDIVAGDASVAEDNCDSPPEVRYEPDKQTLEVANCQLELHKRPVRYENRLLGSAGKDILDRRLKAKYANKPLDFWLMKRRQALRRSLSLLQELQHNTPSLITVNHYNDLWHRTIEELIGGDFLAWGKNIFSLLSKDGPNEDITETVRACNRLNEHLDGLVEATSDLAALAHQVDPRALSKHVKVADFQNAQAHTLKDALVQMLDLHAEGVESLRKAELRKELLYQID